MADGISNFQPIAQGQHLLSFDCNCDFFDRFSPDQQTRITSVALQELEANALNCPMSRYVIKAIDTFFDGQAKPRGGMHNVKFDTYQKQSSFLEGTGIVFTDILLTSRGLSLHTEINVLQFCSRSEQGRVYLADNSFKTPGIVGNHHLLLHPTVSGETSSASAFRWAQARLDDCQNNHQLPPCADQRNRLPTRLLDLTSFDERFPEKGRIKVWEPRLEDVGRYICLSYSWGGDQPLKLRQSNLAAFTTEGMRWVDLPNVTQEVIQFTQRLGFAYLWIDALCIIQDSQADKDHEITHMGTVYRNSQLVLCITKSKSVQDTCYGLVEREFTGIQMEKTDNACDSKDISVRRALRHFNHATGYSRGSNSREFHLLSRAWTFQEVILAPRILHFGPQELLWECRGCQACQCGNACFGTGRGRDLISSLPPNPTPGQVESHIESWELLLTNYASRDLTFGGDRCGAILGVVDCMRSSEVVHNFHAGLWTSHLKPLLLWSVSAKPQPRPNTLWPTWSWLSVCFDKGVNLQHWTPRRAGRAEGRYLFDAQLSLHASAEARSDRFNLDITGQLVRFPGKKFEVDSPSSQCEGVTSLPWFLHEKYGVFVVDLDCLEAHENPKIVNGELFFVPMLMDKKNVYFLLLRPAQGKDDCYERLGIGIFFFRSSPSSDTGTLESFFYDDHRRETFRRETIVVV